MRLTHDATINPSQTDIDHSRMTLGRFGKDECSDQDGEHDLGDNVEGEEEVEQLLGYYPHNCRRRIATCKRKTRIRDDCIPKINRYGRVKSERGRSMVAQGAGLSESERLAWTPAPAGANEAKARTPACKSGVERLRLWQRI